MVSFGSRNKAMGGSTKGNGRIQCPDPENGVRALIVHRITKETCHERQRSFYYKCHTCRNRMGHPSQQAAPQRPTGKARAS